VAAGVDMQRARMNDRACLPCGQVAMRLSVPPGRVWTNSLLFMPKSI
jgi:hypothetical protein